MIIVDILSENPEKNFAPYQNMTNAIASIVSAKGKCVRTDLRTHNFSSEEVNTLMPVAMFFAEIEMEA
ncbi:MAG: hypothetical protein PHX43_01055 [Alphaproteobacteria bacterium]|nr:hypothetical protein [Alphaproteobacteria bacterium]